MPDNLSTSWASKMLWNPKLWGTDMMLLMYIKYLYVKIPHIRNTNFISWTKVFKTLYKVTFRLYVWSICEMDLCLDVSRIPRISHVYVNIPKSETLLISSSSDKGFNLYFIISTETTKSGRSLTFMGQSCEHWPKGEFLQCRRCA